MPPRRTHTKSRNGCAKCKKRRVKCDEVHPSCGNCIKHAIECDFSSVQAPGGLDTPTPGSAPTPKSQVTTSSFHSGTTSILQPCNLEFSLASLSIVPQQQKLTFPLAINPFGWTTGDMELMHHFIMVAPGFLSARGFGHVWRDAVPRLAFGDKYSGVMHAMLAVSSLHLGFMEHGDRSVRIVNAMAHCDQAARMVGMMLSDISRGNCEALFVSSALITVFATAIPLYPRHSSLENEQWTLPEWLPLIRGLNSIRLASQNWVEKGSLKPIFQVQFISRALMPDDIGKVLDNLHRFCTDISEPDTDEIQDTETSLTYSEAIGVLRLNFSMYSEPANSLASLVFYWPVCVSAKYVVLLKERRPRALIIFAYYCALLKLGAIHWWLDGRAEYELLRIERYIRERWHEWLEWPKKMVWGEVRA